MYTLGKLNKNGLIMKHHEIASFEKLWNVFVIKILGACMFLDCETNQWTQIVIWDSLTRNASYTWVK